MTVAAIFTCAGHHLTDDERAFFKDANPFGFILFADNINTPDQIRALTESLRETVGRDDAPILIDQEGGRVARLTPPQWRSAPPAKVFGDLALGDMEAARRAAEINARLIASELYDLGINVDCAPVLDLSIPGAHDVIGDRSFGSDPDLVIVIARAFADGLMAGGVLPMIKHVPGHGRAMADSHKELPTINLPRAELETTDFAPFKGLSDMPLAMTAHILFPQIDPERPATVSPLIIEEIVRGYIGFEGLVVSDDVTMAALSGTDRERAEQTRKAGCDIVLHCYADLPQMQEIASGSGELSEESASRFENARKRIADDPQTLDTTALSGELDELLKA
tara:strand:- start:362 stop:1372 length:1011 start_codon:yes stop_codon:yes gene_type:complete